MATAVPEFQSLLTGLVDELGPKLDLIVSTLSPLGQSDMLRIITDAYPEVTTPYLAAAGDVTAEWYDAQPVDLDAPPFSARPADLAPEAQLAASARWAMLQNDPYTALRGTAARAVFNSSRETVVQNAYRENVRWARHASPKACGFCRMLATRGAEYRTQASARKSHDHCHCLAVPDRNGSFQVEPYVHQWQADYKNAVKDGASGAKAIALHMDRAGAERVSIAAGHAKNAAASASEDLAFTHQQAVEYWRRVDDEDLHSVPAEIAVEPLPPAVPETAFGKANREFEEALESGDDARIAAAADALEAVEEAESKAARRLEQAAARKAAKESEQSSRMLALIEDGVDPADAEAEVTGRSLDFIRRRDFIASARAEGHTGKGFDELVKLTHWRMVDEMALAAENATNGVMLKKQYVLKVNPKNLWSVNEETARKWMSEEMAAWFDEHGRITRPVLAESILSGRNVTQLTHMVVDFLQ